METGLCVAVVICRDVVEDRRTNNKTLINVLNTITTKQLPAVQAGFFVLVSIANSRDHRQIQIMIRDPNGEPLLSVPLLLESADPLQTHDFMLELLAVSLNLTGQHSIDDSCDNRHLGSRRFLVDCRPT